MDNQILPPHRRLNLRRIAWITISLSSVGLLCIALRFDSQAHAQDYADPKPVYETRYRAVTENNVTRLIPETRLVSGFPPNAKRQQLPHASTIGPLVQSILNAQARGDSDASNGQPSTDTETEQVKAKLESMLGDQFDAMSQEQEQQIDQLMQRVEKLKAQHQARAEARDEIIARRMNELLRQPDPLAWDPNSVKQTATLSVGVPGPARMPVGGAVPYQSRVLVPSNVPVPADVAAPAPYPISSPYAPSPATNKTPRISAGFAPPTKMVRSEDSIDALIQKLYAAVGRASVDNSPEAIGQLKQAIEEARSRLKSVPTYNQRPISRDVHTKLEELKRLEETLNSVFDQQGTESRFETPKQVEPGA